MADKPIKFNPKGKYNLNFIDWQNQWERIAQSQYNGEEVPKQSPIYGMSPEQFHKLMLQDSVTFRLEQDSLEKQLFGIGIKLAEIKKMKVGHTEKQCTVCLIGFIKGQVIRVLKCKHIFHDQCIVPWLQKRSVCPNCRADLKQ